MAHAIMNDLPSLLKGRPKEPFDTLISRLIALSALQTEEDGEQDEAETEWAISEKGNGFIIADGRFTLDADGGRARIGAKS